MIFLCCVIFCLSLGLYAAYWLRINLVLSAASGPVSLPPSAPIPRSPEAAPPLIEHDYLDMDALNSRARAAVPPVQLDANPDGVYAGGAASGYPNVWISGGVSLDEPPLRQGDRRQAHRRRAEDRRAKPHSPDRPPDGTAERRLAERRVLLRRAEDQTEYDLVDIDEAARILSVTPDTIDKWILTADLPFYMVTRGALREKRFDRVELLGWLGAEDVIDARARIKKEEHPT